MSQIVIQEVVVDTVKKGRNSYQVASVTYSDNGKNFTKKIMSFANPKVFDVVQNAKQGERYDVSVVKDGDYWNWSALKMVTGEQNTPERAQPATGGKVLGSNYETADERKLRQLYIIKQSSISNAIEFLKGDENVTVAEVLNIAQHFVDYVYGTNQTLEEMDSDIPE